MAEGVGCVTRTISPCVADIVVLRATVGACDAACEYPGDIMGRFDVERSELKRTKEKAQSDDWALNSWLPDLDSNQGPAD
ncbi:MAG: hypothetical protein V7606_2976 [Burkholderiales bacterium]